MLEVHSVTKTFGNLKVLDQISFTIPKAEVVALLGVNGAGKSTLIDIILDLQTADTGRVELFRQTPKHALRQGLVGAALQDEGLIKDYSVIDTLAIFANLNKVANPVITELLTKLRLTDIQRRRVAACSGGEKQRLKLAIALINQPQLLILDEPTVGLDIEMQEDLWSLLQSFKDKQKSILFSTHYLAEASKYADRVLMIDQGKIVFDQTKQQILTGKSSLEEIFKQIRETNRKH